MPVWTRRGVLAAGAGLVGAAVAGCSGGEELPLPMPSSEPVINFLTYTDGFEEKAFQDLFKRFQQTTGIRVKMEVIPFADMAETLTSRIKRGAQPDVARVVDVGPYVGDVLDLREYEPARFQRPFLAEFDPMITDGDRVIAAPTDVFVSGLFINRDLFRRADVPAPSADHPWRSWADLFSDAMRVKTRATSEYAFLMDVSPLRFLSMLSSYGTTFFDRSGRVAVFDVDIATKAIAQFAEMHAGGGMPMQLFSQAGGQYKSGAEVFAAGQAPVYLSGSWQVAEYDANLSFDWGVAPNVIEKRSGAIPGANYLVALKHGKQQYAAQFIAFMTSAATQLELAESTNSMPTRRDVRAAGATFGLRAEEMEMFGAELDAVPPEAWGTACARGTAATGKVLQEELEKLVSGTATPDGVAAAVRAAAEANAG